MDHRFVYGSEHCAYELNHKRTTNPSKQKAESHATDLGETQCTHVHSIIFEKKYRSSETDPIRSDYKYLKLGSGCSVSHSRNGKGLGVPVRCSSPAKCQVADLSTWLKAAAIAQSSPLGTQSTGEPRERGWKRKNKEQGRRPTIKLEAAADLVDQ
jgi:hypothetical protein